MGNANSRFAALNRLSNALPPYPPVMLGNDDEWKLQGRKAFASEQHRQQFIQSLMMVLADNGKVDLTQHEFALFHLPQDNGALGTVLVATKDGKVDAKVESFSSQEKDRVESFCSFVVDVEKKLRVLLTGVPSLLPTEDEKEKTEPPPAYENT